MPRKRQPNKLSENHIRILDALQCLLEEQGFPPSLRELGERVGINSTSHLNYLLRQLEEQGFIRRQLKISRGIQLLKMPGGQMVDTSAPYIHRIPILGFIQAGEPIPVPDSDFSMIDPESNFLDLPSSLLPNRTDDLYALIVKGDSMKDAMIVDKDRVILRQIDAPKNGDMVAARLKENGETTLKFFFREGDQVRLQPANPDYKPIYVKLSDLEIQGKVVSVLRQLPA